MFGRGRGFGRGFGRGSFWGYPGWGPGWGRGFGRGFGFWWGGRGNPFPFCRNFPWLPRWWWATPYASSYAATIPYYAGYGAYYPYYPAPVYPPTPFGYGYGGYPTATPAQGPTGTTQVS